MLFLDTNICVAFLNGSAALQRRFLSNEGRLAVPSVVAAELFYGFELSARAAQNAPKLESFLSSISIIEFDLEAARTYGEIQFRMKKMGQPVPAVDALIAAVTMSQDGTLVTHDKRSFPRIPGLKVEDWIE